MKTPKILKNLKALNKELNKDWRTYPKEIQGRMCTKDRYDQIAKRDFCKKMNGQELFIRRTSFGAGEIPFVIEMFNDEIVLKTSSFEDMIGAFRRISFTPHNNSWINERTIPLSERLINSLMDYVVEKRLHIRICD